VSYVEGQYSVDEPQSNIVCGALSRLCLTRVAICHLVIYRVEGQNNAYLEALPYQ